MRVISLINGSLISETAALYALYYAKLLNFHITFIHIESKDSLEEVNLSVNNLSLEAKFLGVENNFLVLKKVSQLKDFVKNKEVDIIFSSTRHNHSILDKSFVDKIISLKLKTDLAVLKIVKLGNIKIDNIILPIRETRLSVKKFALATIFSLAYKSKLEIYSLDKLSTKKIANLTKEDRKRRLQEVLFDLKHYIKLLKLNNIHFSIKHDFSSSEGKKVTTHIAKNGYDLAIVGAHTDFIFKHPIDVLFKNPMINTLYFIPKD